MTFSHLIDELRLREQTARQAQMPGVTLPTFVCVSCNQAREYRKAIREAQA